MDLASFILIGPLQPRITIAPRGRCGGSRGRGGRNNLVSEQVMEESRIDRLEAEIGSIAAGQDRKFRELQETLMQAITSMNTRLDQISGSQSLGRGESSHDGGGSRRFNYRGSRDSTESYGAILKEEEGEVTWFTLKEGLNSKYGPTEFDDFFGDLTRLKQVGSVREYQSQFEKLLSRVGKLNQSQQVACFIGGLKEGVRIDVQAMKPPTLSAAVGLARLYEVEYRKGAENVVADTLLRKEEKAELAAISTPVPRWLDTIKEEVLTNSKLQYLVKLVQEGEAVGPWEFKEGVLFFKSRIYLNSDSPLLPVIIQEFHSSFHIFWGKVLEPLLEELKQHQPVISQPVR
nr:hypothetical protein CFP56_67495 [Quercus suber]